MFYILKSNICKRTIYKKNLVIKLWHNFKFTYQTIKTEKKTSFISFSITTSFVRKYWTTSNKGNNFKS